LGRSRAEAANDLKEENVPKIVVSQFLTLDGVMQAPGDPEEDRSGGFDQGGWQLPYFDEVFGSFVMEGFAATDGLLLGRRTYENFARHMPSQPADDPVAGPMNEWRKYVVSTSLAEPLEWQNSTLISGDVPSEVAQLKQGQGKDIQVMGSGQLVQTLIRHDLVDEYRLMVHPLVLGTGKRLFRDDTPPTRFRLLDSRTSGKGVLLLTYGPAGDEAAAEEA
jgi:dihydrofolate reductase